MSHLLNRRGRAHQILRIRCPARELLPPPCGVGGVANSYVMEIGDAILLQAENAIQRFSRGRGLAISIEIAILSLPNPQVSPDLPHPAHEVRQNRVVAAGCELRLLGHYPWHVVKTNSA